MNETFSDVVPDSLPAPLRRLMQVDKICEAFESQWKAGVRPMIESFLSEAVESMRSDVLRELAAIDVIYRRRLGEDAALADYAARFPEYPTCFRGNDNLSTVLGDPAIDSVAHRSTFNDSSRIAANFHEYVAKHVSRLVPRYAIDAEIARGGMGVVLRGKDNDLGREVAIKVLLERHGNEPDLQKRFTEEARIASQLQHPGIVPVYEVGMLADDRPYFTMKLVRGETLASLLAVRTDPTQDHVKVLKAFEQVCQAVAYAHSRRVIHRDLKPHNIMVGKFGEVQVMDWGLAKLLPGESAASDAGNDATTDPEIDRVRRLDRNHRGDGSSNAADTTVGTILGTLAYMAPEQARGEVDRLDSRADVFSLGSILCEILTGFPAHRGAAKGDLWERARRGDLADAIRRLDECRADAELVSLTKRCLAIEPDRRPADAAELAAEISNYFEAVDERLQIERLVAAEERARADEGVRRRRLIAAGAATLIAVLILGITGTTWALIESGRNRRTAESEARQRELARAAEAEQRIVAERSLAVEQRIRTQAIDALTLMTDDVVEELLADLSPGSVARTSFCRRLIALYDAFSEQAGDSEEAREFAARGRYQAARLRYCLGERDGIDDAFKESLRRADELSADFPSNPDYAVGAAICRVGYARTLMDQDRYREAEVSLHQASQSLDRLLGSHRLVPDNARLATADAHLYLGDALLRLKTLDEAESEMKTALCLFVGLHADADSESARVKLSGNLAHGHRMLGKLFAEARRYSEAEEQFREALRVIEPLERQSTEVRALAGGLHRELADLFAAIDRPQTAIQELDEAIVRLTEVCRSRPHVLSYQELLLSHYSQHAFLVFQTGEAAVAENEFRMVVLEYEKLAADFSEMHHLRHEIAASYGNLAGLLLDLGRSNEAIEQYRRSIAASENAVREQPAVRKYRVLLAETHGRLADCLGFAGNTEEALAELRTVVDIRRELLAMDCESADCLFDVFVAQAALAYAVKDVLGPAAAEEEFRAALPTLEKLSPNENGVRSIDAAAGVFHAHYAKALLDLERPAEVLTYCDRASEALDRAAKAQALDQRCESQAADLPMYRGEALILLDRNDEAFDVFERALACVSGADRRSRALRVAWHRARLGDHASAAREATDLVRDAADDGFAQYCAARVCGWAVGVSRDPEFRGKYSAIAVGMLAAAHKNNVFRDPARLSELRTLPDFEALRRDPSFELLLKEIEAPTAVNPDCTTERCEPQ